MKVNLIFILLLFLVVAAVAYLMKRNAAPSVEKNFMVFYREPKMARTPEILQGSEELKNLILEIEKLDICGFIFGVRISQTASNQIRVRDCASQQWIDISFYFPNYQAMPSSYVIRKFALLKFDKGLDFITESDKGQHTLDEYIQYLPGILNILIKNWHKIKSSNEIQNQILETQKNEEVLKLKEIEKSFKK